MPIPARLAIVGDYDSTMYTHLAIDEALGHVRELREHALEWSWLATPTLAANASARLALTDAIWLAPASPYASADGALAAVRYARENSLPFLGVCGGFQHAILEFARNVAGLRDADHAESNPDAATAVIAPLACSLVGKAAPVFLDPTCRTASIYGRWRVVEKYHCNYGLNAEYRAALESAGLRVVGEDDQGDARVIERLKTGPLSSMACLPIFPKRGSTVLLSLLVALHLSTPRGVKCFRIGSFGSFGQ